MMRKIKPESYKEMGMESPMKEKYYPRFSMSLMHLPEAKEWKIGKTYEIKLRIKQTGMSLHKSDSKEHGDATFEIVGIEPKGESKEKVERYT